MALTKCKECGGQLSTKADACPKCGAKRPKRTSTETWFFGGLFVLLVIGFMSSKDRPSDSPPPTAREAATRDPEAEGRILCRMAIKQAAQNPSTVEFGMPQAGQKDGGWAYYWPRGGGLRMQNRMGALNDAEALCVVRGNPPIVAKLSVDGQLVVGR